MKAPLLDSANQHRADQHRAINVKVLLTVFFVLSGVGIMGGVTFQLKTLSHMKDPPGGFGAPLAKTVVVAMDTNVNFHIAWNQWKPWSAEMSPYWTKDMIYDFIYVGDWKFGPSHGLRKWFDDEHMHYNAAIPDCQWTDFIRAATNLTCTSASYGNGRWVAPFAGVPPPPEHPWVFVHDLDFYLLEGDRIKINWCMIDVVNLFDQVGYHTLPPAPMPMDGYLPPKAMDGMPAPLSAMVNPQITVQSEAVWKAALMEDFGTSSNEANFWADDMIWYGPGGIGTAHSRSDYQNYFLKPLHAAFSHVKLDVDQIVCEGSYCGCHAYLHGNHTGEWLGEKPTGNRVPIRMGAHVRIENGKIVEGWLQIDMPLAFKHMGVDLYDRAKKQAVRLGYN